MARLTKWEIAVKIEHLPGNTPWSNASLATLQLDFLSRQEFVDWHNRIIEHRGLSIEPIR